MPQRVARSPYCRRPGPGSSLNDMTCRVACGTPMPEALASVYRELAESGRWDEFRWLARSQGVAVDRIAELWEAMLAQGAEPRPPANAGARSS